MMIWRLSLREIRQNPNRSVLTLISITVGVAAVIAVSLAASSTDRAFSQMFQSLTGNAALEIVAEDGSTFDQSILEAVENVPGVKTAAPQVQRPIILFVNDHRVKLISLGVDPERDADVHDFVVTAGEPLAESTGVTLEAGLAERIGVQPGDFVKLLTRRGLIRSRVAGLFRLEGGVAGSGSVGLLMTLRAAQGSSKMGDKLHSIQILTQPDADEEAVASEIAKVLPMGIIARPPAARSSFADETALSIRNGMETSRAFMLLVATLIIGNTYLINVSQRRQQFGILRAIGATRRQVVSILLAEATLMGLVGAALGWVVGVVGAGFLTRGMGELFQTTLPAAEWTAISLLTAVIFGVGISIVGAYLPARRASRLQPLDAMRDVTSSEIEPASNWSWVAGVIIVLLGGLALAASIVGWLPAVVSAWAGVTILVGMVLLLARAVAGGTRPRDSGTDTCESPARPATAKYRAIETRLAENSLFRHRTRTSLTIGVLFVAISTGVGLSSTVSDNVNDVETWSERTMLADFIVRATSPDMATGQAADLPDEIGAEIDKIANITSIATARFVIARAANRSVIVVAHEYDVGNRQLSEEKSNRKLPFDLTRGTTAGLQEKMAAGEVVIGSVLSRRVGDLGPGDSIVLETESGPQALSIAAVANDYLAGGQTIYMQRSAAQRLLDISGVDAYLIHADHGRLDQVRDSLAVVADEYGLLLQSSNDMQREIDQMMSGVVAGLWSLVLLSFVVAALGVANTLTMNILEQAHELHLLRMIGTTQQQVRRMVLTQAFIMGIVALAPGVIVGIFIAYLISLTTYPVSGHAIPFTFRPILAIGAFVVGMLIVMMAAWFPARRAANMPLGRGASR